MKGKRHANESKIKISKEDTVLSSNVTKFSPDNKEDNA